MSNFNKNLLTPCPVLQPTEEEFMDPIGYLSSKPISELGKIYGIVKIVPPLSWKPEFQISPNFKFHVRQQVLSDLGITTRSRNFFKENLNRFLKMRRRRLVKLYFKVDGQKIYYYDLYCLVEKLGGYQAITSWRDINNIFKVDPKSKAIELEYDSAIKYYANFLNNNHNYEFPESDSDEEDNCLICGDNDDPEETLLCDNCDNAYHMKCLNPPLKQIPVTNWYCDKCLIGTGEYGFEENPEIKYSIPEFYQMCQEFDEEFAKNYNNGEKLSLDQIESKFWSFVDIEKSDLEVKYGADIHNLKPGEISGFPMSNTPNLDTSNPQIQYYINHPYNLTKLPFAKGSLLNYINTSISGMTVPWIYIGSLLSTFCWHVEDHYTLSANYCHFGATKKWYGIPSAFSDSFEKLMKKSAPDLFQKQPDLLHQLVTLMSPMKLIENGIPCVYADQNPNEFVITYPKVYHAGFNCGFNFNEAVNFAMNDWLEFGNRSISEYRPIKKENVFNYYELVENILKTFNQQKEKFENYELVKRSIDILQGFLLEQNSLLNKLKHKNLKVEIRPKHYQKRQFDAEQKGEVYEAEESLCYNCKTHLGFQYGILGNDELKLNNQLLTPQTSPQEIVKKEEAPQLQSIANSNSSIELSKFTKAKCEMDEFDLLILQAKKRSIEEEEDSNSTKRRKSKRILSLEEQQKINPTQRMKRVKKPQPSDSKKICLNCITDKKDIPNDSKLIYQSYPKDLFNLIELAKLNLKALESV
ncbi:uncharacterized protein KGF55_001049 [Candida pseudojiufengensis]|uniref:uncharacterized protein n=1 Tax=Candida pseudojiufengensis TaxID=497109 RepID=UPI002223EF9B|nr:uncharacterized protein KGF55_001049 [Candida pseudojiufengensis]KAI5965687.1 hypothetical protein KGF55_001049 [Candida pseudojiufengensis]